MSGGGYLALVIVSLLVAAFAATAETALNSANRLRMRTLSAAGNRRATLVVRLQEDPNASLSTILTLNTGAVIVASTAATLYALDALPQVSQSIVDVVLSIVALVLCEIMPKSLALRYTDRVVLVVAPVVRSLTVGLRPLVGALTFLGTMPLRLRGEAISVRGPYVTEQELKMLVTVSEQQGVVDEEEREMIHGVLELTDKVVRELMVPRVDIAGVEVSGSIDDVVALITETGHSRVPVYERTIDNVVGVVYAKDLLRQPSGVTLSSLAREPYFVPESKRAGELLHELQTKKVHIAIVVDEYGGTAGLVTMEDLTEEIVGEIRDEYDVAEPEEVQFLGDREALATARLSIDDARELLGLDIDPVTIESDSLGGLIYERMGEIPRAGATVVVGDLTLTVDSVRRNSIRAVRIQSQRPFPAEAARADAAEAGIEAAAVSPPAQAVALGGEAAEHAAGEPPASP